MIFVVIDIYKEQDVAVVEIPGAYLSADMDDDVFNDFPWNNGGTDGSSRP